MKYHVLFVLLFFLKKKKNSKIWNCLLLQIIGGALRVKLKNTKVRKDKSLTWNIYGWTGVTLNAPAIGQVAKFEKIWLTDDGDGGRDTGPRWADISYIRRLESFLGGSKFWISLFWGGFQKNEYFGGMKILCVCFFFGEGVITKLVYI